MEPLYLGLDTLDSMCGVGYLKETCVHTTYPLHRHGFMELFLVLRGTAIHRLNGEDQLICRGTLMLLRPQDAHCYHAFNDYEYHMISCGFDAAYFDAACAYLGRDAAQWLSGGPRAAMLREASLADAERLLDRVAALQEARRVTYFRAILPLLLTYFDEETQSAPARLPQWLATLVHQMSLRENFTLGLPRMLELAGCSQEHLTRAFHRYIGATPTQFINTRRVAYAAELLLQGERSALDVCYASGFGSPSTFYECFRRVYGCSPQQFVRSRQRPVAP